MQQSALDFAGPPARARSTDAETSHEAAERENRSGRASRQRARVFAMVEATPGLTSAELAARHVEDRSMVARRLPELRESGLLAENRHTRGAEGMARTCTVKRTTALTWWPTG